LGTFFSPQSPLSAQTVKKKLSFIAINRGFNKERQTKVFCTNFSIFTDPSVEAFLVE